MNPRLHWLREQLNKEFCQEPGMLEHLRMQRQATPQGRSESHWLVLDAVPQGQLTALAHLLEEFQRQYLHEGEGWVMDACNQGLLQPQYQVTLEVQFKS